MSVTYLILAALATYRGTMLVTNDYITRPYRVRVLKYLKNTNHPKLRYGLTCPWCASMWVGAVIVGTGHLAQGANWWAIPAGVLSASAFTGIVAVNYHPNGNDGLHAEVDG